MDFCLGVLQIFSLLSYWTFIFLGTQKTSARFNVSTATVQTFDLFPYHMVSHVKTKGDNALLYTGIPNTLVLSIARLLIINPLASSIFTVGHKVCMNRSTNGGDIII